VIKCIAIASPLKGARFIQELEDKMNVKVKKYLKPKLMRPVYEDLKEMCYDKFKPPPHDYYTISTSWPGLNFDGCVYKDETMIDEKNIVISHFRIIAQFSFQSD
jgi:hypothetical protein